jgi:hypothetical protein
MMQQGDRRMASFLVRRSRFVVPTFYVLRLDENNELAWGFPLPGWTFYVKTRMRF